MIEVSISLGELVDKITILKIKQSMIKHDDKLMNISAELKHLTDVFDQYKKDRNIDIPVFLIDKLYSINLSLWNIEDWIRIKERDQDFGEEFVELARSVYLTNDQRFDTKRQINLYDNASFQEQKSYESYDV
tara:strand:- start:4515 stop:4910 length:396 start_codon:yes stop_codon:yes gene_type:complete